MKVVQCEQGSYAWFRARLGKPTASNFGRILTQDGALRSASAVRRYTVELLGERLTQEPHQNFETDAMRRGVENEPRARAWYELTTGVTVRRIGFVTSECERWGCSPDGLIGDVGGLEIKCPMLDTFVDIAESGKLPPEHMMQVQASLWITGFNWWDYVVWTDRRGMVPVVMRIEPDAELHADLDKVIPKFCDDLDAREKKMREAGHGYTQEEDCDDGKPLFDEE